MSADLDEIKRSVDLAEYASSHYGISSNRRGFALCPFHAEKTPSFHFFQGKDGTYRFQDFHDSQGGTIVDLKARLENVEEAEACRGLLAEFNGNGNGEKPKRVPIREHVYRDEKGAIAYKKIKYSKGNFPFLHLKDGEWANGKGDHPHVPYRADKIKDEPVVILAEGEKDADTLAELGFAATSMPCGVGDMDSSGTVTPHLAGKRVLVLYDVGNEAHARKIAGVLSAACPDIRILEIPGKDPVADYEFDISDYLEAFETQEAKRDAVYGIISAGRPYEPESPPVGGQTKPPETVPVKKPGVGIVIRLVSEQKDELLSELVGRKSAELKGTDIPSIPSLTKAMSGLREIVGLCGREKCGKTTLCLQVAGDAADQGLNVLWFDFEVGPRTLRGRDFCRRMGMTDPDIYLAPEDELREKVAAYNPGRTVYIRDHALDKARIQDYLRALRDHTGETKTLIVIDSLQKLPFKKIKERRHEIDAWLRVFEEIKGDDPNLTLLFTSELSRAGGQPKESGDIEYTCHFLLELRRDGPDSVQIGSCSEPTMVPDNGGRDLWLRLARDVAVPERPFKLVFDFEHWGICER